MMGNRKGEIMDANEKKDVIKKKYEEIAVKGTSCCSGGCCSDRSITDISKSIGYSEDDIRNVPDANLGLGCGNPTAFAELKPGDIVLDLDSGAGFDSFLAAQKLGRVPKIIDLILYNFESIIIKGYRDHFRYRFFTIFLLEQRLS